MGLTLLKRIQVEKPALFFLIKLIVLLSLLKFAFYFYNRNVGVGWGINSIYDLSRVTGWSLLYDIVILAVINLPFFLILLLLRPHRLKRKGFIMAAIFFTLLNTVAILLNIADIFYYHFHLQRADADLLYVLENPLSKTFIPHFFISILSLVFCILIALYVFNSFNKMKKAFIAGTFYIITPVLLACIIIIFLASGKRKAVPTYPLVNITANQLPLAQNSLHTFLYSWYRKDQIIVDKFLFMTDEQASMHFTKQKEIKPTFPGIKKNIVLFIMESIPEDFFNPASRYKVAMPFLDSLVSKSTYFQNAYSYSHSSNNGIVAILAGLPTLTQIPVYHSGYINIPITPLGKELAQYGYQSSFFIGDHYDDFGFAKCCNWLGIKYHSMEDVPGYKGKDKHAMGLQDEHVLSYVLDKITETREPFFMTHFNISTHFPHTLPAGYKEQFGEKNFTAEMKSMNYYSECLRNFFEKAKSMDWYNNTVFIFVADHWMCPDYRDVKLDVVGSFHIPLFIFDPMHEKKVIVSRPVSQLDIMNTILSYTGTADSIISYGNQLDTTGKAGTVFCKENSILYEAIDSSYVLGFNTVTGKAEFCYNFRTDLQRKNNLVKQPGNVKVDSLTYKIKAFLQVASSHYKP